MTNTAVEQVNEHYFVVKATMNKQGDIQFYIDGDTTVARFPEGYVWKDEQWVIPVEGDVEMVVDDLLYAELRKRLSVQE